MSPLVRTLTPADVPACAALAASRGWGAGEERWRLALTTGMGLVIDAPDGGIAATVVRIDYGSLAMAAMLLVRPDLARRGLGRLLMERAAAAGPAPLHLYSTAEGLPLYERLGYREIGTEIRYQGIAAPPPRPEPGNGLRLRPMGVADWPHVAALDEDAFGAPRRGVLEKLFPRAERVVLAVRGGAVVGYGIVWPDVGLDALRIGPVIASDDGVAVTIVSFLASGHVGAVVLDIPSDRLELRRWAREAGLAETGSEPLMSAGGRPAPGRRQRLHALANRALG